MTRQEVLLNLLQNLLSGIERLERNNDGELKDLTFCQEQNVEIKKLIETCDIYNSNNDFGSENSRDLVKDNSGSRFSKMMSQTFEPISARNPKTPAKAGKSVGKNRDGSGEKKELFKTKTLANLKNFSNTAKTLKNDVKSAKTPSNQANKSSLFEKDHSTLDVTSKNKTFAIEKQDSGLKKEKTKANLLTKEETKPAKDQGSKTPREKLNQTTNTDFRRKDSAKIVESKSNVKITSETKKEEPSGFKRNNTSLNVGSINDQKADSKIKPKQASNMNVAKVEKPDQKKSPPKGEKEGAMTNNSSTYNSNKNEELSSPTNKAEKEIKFPSEVNSSQDVINVVLKKPKEIVIDPKIILERKFTCLKLLVRSKFLNKTDLQNYLCFRKDITTEAIHNFISVLRVDQQVVEDKLKVFKDKTPAAELTKDIPPFVISKGTFKAVELLNESLYNKLFTNPNTPNEDILMPYRIYFQLIQHPNSSIKDDKAFWEKACSYFMNENAGKTGDLINGSVKNFDFSEENLAKIVKIIAGREKKIAPTNYSKTCGTTGLIIFLIKDALEYAGVIIDKKTLPARVYKNMLYNVSSVKGKVERLDNFIKSSLQV